jgi:beta-glucosidase
MAADATQLRDEWASPYLLTGDAGSLDLLYSTHGVCPTGPGGAPSLAGRQCAAAAAIKGWSMEMGGGTYVYELLPQLVKAGTVKISDVDKTVESMLRTKFALGLFESALTHCI